MDRRRRVVKEDPYEVVDFRIRRKQQLSEEETFIYNVDSTDKISGTDGNFTISINGLAGYQKVSVYAVTLNKSWWNCPPGYNDFIVNGNTVTLPATNYSILTLPNAIKNALNALGTLGTWTVSADTNSGELTITTTHPTPITIQFSSDLILSRMFGAPTTITFTGTYVSEYTIDLSRTGAIYLCSDIAETNNPKGVIYCIHPVGVPYTAISDQNIDPWDTRLNLRSDANQFRFTFYDDNFNLLDFRGNQTILTLIFYKN